MSALVFWRQRRILVSLSLSGACAHALPPAAAQHMTIISHDARWMFVFAIPAVPPIRVSFSNGQSLAKVLIRWNSRDGVARATRSISWPNLRLASRCHHRAGSGTKHPSRHDRLQWTRMPTMGLSSTGGGVASFGSLDVRSMLDPGTTRMAK